jgi:TfoX/Sxy family transcriptional regulator of competence genes
MAYDEGLAQRIREALDAPSVEKKMFGGIAFLVDGNLCVGVRDVDLLARVGEDASAAALRRPGVRPFEMSGGRAPKGWVLVEPAALKKDKDLAAWIDQSLAFVRTLPPK